MRERQPYVLVHHSSCHFEILKLSVNGRFYERLLECRSLEAAEFALSALEQALNAGVKRA